MLFKQGISDHKYLYLLGSILLYFISRALYTGPAYEFLVNIFFSFNIIVSVFIVGLNKRKITIAGIVLAVITFGSIWSRDIAGPTFALSIIASIFSLFFLSFITMVVLHHTFSQQNVTSETILGATCSYLLLGFVWSTIYGLVFQFNPDAFSFVLLNNTPSIHEPDFIYYSFVTLTTLGYGDIVPKSELAQTISWIEAVTGQLFLTVLVAQIVGDYISQKRGKRE